MYRNTLTAGNRSFDNMLDQTPPTIVHPETDTNPNNASIVVDHEPFESYKQAQGKPFIDARNKKLVSQNTNSFQRQISPQKSILKSTTTGLKSTVTAAPSQGVSKVSPQLTKTRPPFQQDSFGDVDSEAFLTELEKETARTNWQRLYQWMRTKFKGRSKEEELRD